MDPTRPTSPLCELAPSWALGALTADECLAFEVHLNRRCTHCESEIEALRAVVADLPFVAPAQLPPARLRERILERIAAESILNEQPVVEKEGVLFARSSRMDWIDLPFEGVSVRPLSVDPLRQVTTQIVRMQPGSRYPSHRHGGTEELYLLEGDVVVNGIAMRPGDYCRADPGSIHHDISTGGGCLFLSSTSADDEIFI